MIELPHDHFISGKSGLFYLISAIILGLIFLIYAIQLHAGKDGFIGS